MTGTEISGLGALRPFPGLRPYGTADSAWFFGRERQVRALYRLLASEARLIAVVGSSGSGKSSLVKAGLLPAIANEVRGGEVPETADLPRWKCMQMRPGDSPITELTDAIAGPLPDKEGEDEVALHAMHRDRIDLVLRSSSFGFIEALRDVAQLGGQTVLLVVDQFEEVFRLARSGGDPHSRARRGNEAAAFVALLLQASADRSFPVRIMLTMRSDYIGDCARFPGLAEAVADSQFLVPMMTRDSREDVIRKPIARAGATIDDQLVQTMLNDSSPELDQLPVLQHALMRVWEMAGRRQAASGNAGQRQLTLDSYREAGGIAEALTKHADEVSRELGTPEQQRALELCFRALAELDREGRAVRRALPFGRLLAETGVDKAELQAVVDRFRADDCSFLVPPPVKPIADDTVVDIGHEALIRNWVRLSGGPDAKLLIEKRSDWLATEVKDGQEYRALLAIAERSSDPMLSRSQTEHWSKWWAERKRTPEWAERYDDERGELVKVHSLLEKSRAMARLDANREKATAAREKRSRAVIRGLAFLVAAAVTGGGVLSTIALVQVSRERDAAVASTIWSRFSLSDRETLARDEVDAAWELASESPQVRSFFVQQAIDERRPFLLGKMSSPHSTVLLQAVGLRLSVEATNTVLDTARNRLEDQRNPETIGMPAQVVVALSQRLTQQQADRTLKVLLDLSESRKGGSSDLGLSDAVISLADRASPNVAHDAFVQIATLPTTAGGDWDSAKIGRALNRYVRNAGGDASEVIAAFLARVSAQEGDCPYALPLVEHVASAKAVALLGSVLEGVQAADRPQLAVCASALGSRLIRTVGERSNGVPLLDEPLGRIRALRFALAAEQGANAGWKRRTLTALVAAMPDSLVGSSMFDEELELMSAGGDSTSIMGWGRTKHLAEMIERSGCDAFRAGARKLVEMVFDGLSNTPTIGSDLLSSTTKIAACVSAEDAPGIAERVVQWPATDSDGRMQLFAILTGIAPNLQQAVAATLHPRLWLLRDEQGQFGKSGYYEALTAAALALYKAAGQSREDLRAMIQTAQAAQVPNAAPFAQVAAVLSRQDDANDQQMPPENANSAISAAIDAVLRGEMGSSWDQAKLLRHARSLSAQDAARHLARILEAFGQASFERQFFVIQLQQRLEQLALELATRLDGDPAQSLLKTAILRHDRMQVRRRAATLTRVEAALVRRLVPSSRQMAIAACLWGLSVSASRSEASAWATALIDVLSGEPPRSFAENAVAALKYPTVAGAAADILMNGLRDRLQGPGASEGMPATVDWVARNYREIDLEALPVRPGRPF